MPAVASASRHLLVITPVSALGDALRDRFERDGTRVTVTAGDVDPYALRSTLEPVFADDAPDVVVYDSTVLDDDASSAADPGRAASASAVGVIGAIVVSQLAGPVMRAAGGGTLLFLGGEGVAGEEPTLALGRETLRAVASILAGQLAEVPVHVAGVTVADRSAAPVDVAESLWRIHAAPVEDRRTDYRVAAG